MIVIAAALSMWLAPATVTHPRPVPATLTTGARAGLVMRAGALETRALALDERLRKQSADCGAVSSSDPGYAAKVERCTNERAEIERGWDDYEAALDTYEADLDAALSAASPPPMPEKAADLVDILEAASADLRLPKIAPAPDPDDPDLRCQDYFRAVGTRVGAKEKEGWAESIAKLHSANEIAAAIAADAASASPHWRALPMADAQALADRGVIVIGASRNKKGHGHLAIVEPAPPGLDLSKFAEEGTGPFVRDGNRHTMGRSTWGAIRASRAFKLGETTWYVWIPSE